MKPRHRSRLGSLAATSIIASLLCTSVHAQSSQRIRPQPITGAIKDAGVYHLGAGTWTRHSHVALIAGSSDILYNNTCNTGYFGAQGLNETWSDEGRVPSPWGPVVPPNENAGCHSAYTIEGFQIAYCTTLTTRYDITIGFQSSYTTCATSAPTQSFALTGLPHGTSSGGQNCWTVSIDLDALSQTFTLTADGTGTFPSGDAATNHLFGWQFTTNVATPPNSSGPVIAGMPLMTSLGPCPGVGDTAWDTLPGQPPSTSGTGMDTQAQFRIDNSSSVSSGCYFFGGGLLGSFHLTLNFHGACPSPHPGSYDCVPGTAAVLACPCGNPQSPALSIRGCNNSSATGGATLISSGIASLAADILVFHAIDEKPTASSILLQGNAFNAGGIVFGQGIRCVAGNLKRLYLHTASGGNVTAPSGADAPVSARSAALGDPIPAGTTREYLMYYRDPVVLGGCASSSTFNATQGQSITWQP
jgi:hypothetical protein